MCCRADVKVSEKHSLSPSMAQCCHPRPMDRPNTATLCDAHGIAVFWKSTYSVAIFLSSASFFLFWKEPFFLLDLEKKRDVRWSLAPAHRFSAECFPKIAESIIFCSTLDAFEVAGRSGRLQADQGIHHISTFS